MNYAIMLAGGTGTRTEADKPKQFIRAAGRMMITYSLFVIASYKHIDKTVVVCEEEWEKDILTDAHDAGLDLSKIAGFARPGRNRQESILNGMKEILKLEGIREPGNDDTVIVHDSARPYLTEKLLDACYDAIKDHDGVMPVLPMKDTVYMGDGNGKITELLDRSRVFAGQAPELFKFKDYYKANTSVTDEELMAINGASEIAVKAGMDIVMIPGDERNTKITTKGDLEKFIR